jgi:hypothetical protein
MVQTPVPAAPAPPTPPPPGTPWWQWAFVYPALATSLFAAVPTVWQEVKAWHLGVSSSKLQLVEEQERLWRRNLECVTHQGIYEADGADGLVIKVTLCPTGDILVRYHFNDWTPSYRWVGRPDKPTKP